MTITLHKATRGGKKPHWNLNFNAQSSISRNKTEKKAVEEFGENGNQNTRHK